jgi:hypothetical protein
LKVHLDIDTKLLFIFVNLIYPNIRRGFELPKLVMRRFAALLHHATAMGSTLPRSDLVLLLKFSYFFISACSNYMPPFGISADRALHRRGNGATFSFGSTTFFTVWRSLSALTFGQLCLATSLGS